MARRVRSAAAGRVAGRRETKWRGAIAITRRRGARRADSEQSGGAVEALEATLMALLRVWRTRSLSRVRLIGAGLVF